MEQAVAEITLSAGPSGKRKKILYFFHFEVRGRKRSMRCREISNKNAQYHGAEVVNVFSTTEWRGENLTLSRLASEYRAIINHLFMAVAGSPVVM